MERIPESVQIGFISGLITAANSVGLYLLQTSGAPVLVLKACALSTGGLLLAGAGVSIYKFKN